MQLRRKTRPRRRYRSKIWRGSPRQWWFFN